MKKLKIEITQAQLISFQVKLEDGLPQISATIALLTAGGKQITNYTIATDAWQDGQKFELPMTAIKPIKAIMDILEAVVVKHCNNNMLALPAGEVVE